MTRICQSCGAATAHEARFCRKCGAPQRPEGGDGENVSPQAATIPLRDEGRTTDGLAGDDPRRNTPETARVGRAEMESILQRAARSAELSIDPNATMRQPPGEQTSPEVRTALPPTPPGTPSSAPLSEEDLMKTRPAIREEPDEELTVMSPRPFTGEVSPRPVQHVATTGPLGSSPAAGAEPTAAAPPVSGQAQPPPPQTARKRSPWILVGVVCAVLLCVAVVGAWLAVKYLRRPATESATVEPTAPAADDKQLAQDKLVEAEAMLATGDLNGAVVLLREAVRLDPSSARAHRRLGDILLETGARRDGIEELRAVTRLDPNDFTAWRALAAAQLAEGLPADAAESYKRLVALTGESDPNDTLSYADALRLSGRAEEARALYQTLSSSAVADVADAARRHLAELASATSAPTPQPSRDPRAGVEADGASETQASAEAAPTPQQTPTPVPTPQPTPQQAQSAQMSPGDHYRRGVELWASNRAAAAGEFRAAAGGGNVDANYYLGLNLVEGKNLGSLKRAEVVAALRFFQVAQSGSHGAQARRYVQQLEKEFDRIRSQQ